MGYRREFPDYDDMLYIPHGWKDLSWHNDTMPRAGSVLLDIPQVQVIASLWQDYRDINLRECQVGGRFFFEIQVNGESIFEYGSDNLDNIKPLIRATVGGDV